MFFRQITLAVLISTGSLIDFEETIAGSISSPENWESEFSSFPKDANGWSTIQPSEDSRLMYVSSSEGSDSTGKIYTASDNEINGNPHHPQNKLRAFASIEAAIKNMRPGYPDWILLKRGDVWHIDRTIEMVRGRSALERSVISFYGDASDRPSIRTSESDAVSFVNGTANYSVLNGLHFYAQNRDPKSDTFAGFDSLGSQIGLKILENENLTEGILIEDCHFDFYAVNYAQVARGGSGKLRDVTVRRSFFTNAYDANKHSQGLFSANASMLLEENIFDHNGWYKQSLDGGVGKEKAEGQATIYNHNTYFANQKNTIFRRNIFLRASSIHNKFTANSSGETDSIRASNILVDGNYYQEGEIGISAGGNKDFNTGPRWRNIVIRGNTLTAMGVAQPTGRNLGWGIEISDWSRGLVEKNRFYNWGHPERVNNTYAIRVKGHTSDLDIQGNSFQNIRGSTNLKTGLITVDWKHSDDVSVHQNHMVQTVDSPLPFISEVGVAKDVIFIGNALHYDERDAPAFMQDGKLVNFDRWQTSFGDRSGNYRVTGTIQYGKSIQGYLASIGESQTEIEDFVARAVSESRLEPNYKYKAGEVLDYISNQN